MRSRNTSSTAREVARGALAVAVCVLLAAAACNASNKHRRVAPDDAPISRSDDASPPAQTAMTPISDVIVDPAHLPPGATAQIGVPHFVASEALGHLVVRADGAILGFGHEYARLWDGGTGDALWSTRTSAHGLFVAAAEHSDVVAVVEDGGFDSRLTVFDARTGAVSYERPYGEVFGVAVSPDGRYVLVMSNTLSLVDLQTRSVALPPKAVVASVGRVDDDHHVTVVRGEEVLAWSGALGAAPVPVAQLPVRARAAAFASGGGQLAWGAGDRLGVVDLTAGATLMDVEAPGLAIATIAVSRDGKHVATGSPGKLAVWDVGIKQPAWEHEVRYKANPPASFLADGDVVLGDVSKLVRLSAAGTPRPAAPVTRFVGFAADGTALVDVDGRMTGLDLARRVEVPAGAREEEPVPAGAPAWVDRAYVATDGDVVAWNDDEGTECGHVRIWRAGKSPWTTPKPKDCDGDARIGPWVFGPGMVADTSTGSPILFDPAAEAVVLEIPAEGRAIEALVSSPDRDLVVAVFARRERASNGDDEEGSEPDDAATGPGFDVEVWSRASGKLLVVATAPAERGGVRDALVPRGGKKAYIGWADGAVDELALPQGTLSTLGRHATAVRSLDDAPAGGYVASMDEDGRTLVWSP